MNLGISEQIQTRREDFSEFGYVVLKRVFSEQFLDWHAAELAAFLLRSPEVNAAKGNAEQHREISARRSAFHWHSAEVLQLAMHSTITDALRALLLEEPFLLHVGTLNNDESTGNVHNFLNITSAVRHINVWIALKDVKAENDPLWIVPGSHHLTENHLERVLGFQPSLAAQLASMRESGAPIDRWRQLEREVSAVSNAMLARYVEEKNLSRLALPLKRGDIVLFHERLIHGTLKSAARDLPRWCLVAQYGSICHPRSSYFSRDLSDE